MQVNVTVYANGEALGTNVNSESMADALKQIADLLDVMGTEAYTIQFSLNQSERPMSTTVHRLKPNALEPHCLAHRGRR